jgi:hypothetical protein
MWADENATAVDPQERENGIALPAWCWAVIGAGLVVALWALIVGLAAAL